MELKEGTVLNQEYIILHTLKSEQGYIFYQALSVHNGLPYQVAEFCPDDAARSEAGELTIPYEALKEFDVMVNRLIMDIETVVTLKLNDYLKTVTSFSQSGTGFVVTDAIQGYSFRRIMSQKKTPFTVDEATPVFLEFLSAAAEAESCDIFFHISPDTVYVTEDGDLRLDYCYIKESDGKKTAADMARFLAFMLGFDPNGSGVLSAQEEDGPEKHAALIDALNQQCAEGTALSLAALYDGLTAAYNAEPAKKNEGNGGRLPSVRFVVTVAAILFCLATTIAISSYFVTKLLWGKPQTIQASDEMPPPDPKKNAVFDVR